MDTRTSDQPRQTRRRATALSCGDTCLSANEHQRSAALSLSFLLSCAQAFAIVMSAAFVLYVCLIIVPYLRHRPAPPGDPALFQWHFFVPCRDEELVIGDTIRYLRTRFPAAHVWVIDDHSDDH